MEIVDIYCRLSDEDKDKPQCSESESIQNQKSMLISYALKQGWEINNIYCDEDYSGTDNSRPDFLKMIEDCKNKKVNIVLCKSQSRFSRDMEIIEKYIHNLFVEWGIRFVSVVDNADTMVEGNKKSRQINGLINEWYCEDLSINIRKTLEHKRKNGEFTGSFAPYGYLIDPNDKHKLIVDKEVAPIVKRIFDMYAQGYGYREICIRLNQENILNPSAYKASKNSKYVNNNENNSTAKGKWTTATIYRMIRNEYYIGTLVQGKSHMVSYKNKKVVRLPSDEWIRVFDAHKAIIDLDIWNNVQDRLKSRVRIQRNHNIVAPLSGKVRCVCCGCSMAKQVYYNYSKTDKYYSLRCANYNNGALNCENTKSISGLKLESVVLSEINKLLHNYCNMNDITIEYQDGKEKVEDTINNIQKQITTKENQITKLFESYTEDLITKEQFKSLNEKFIKEIEQLKANLQKNNLILQKKQDKDYQITKRNEIIKKYSHIEELTKPIVDVFINMVYIDKVVPNEDRNIIIDWKI